MYIKSIVIDGFKSYGQRTEIKGFDTEFNAITGLNGTGKSNILDAICFVLGISNLSQVRAGSLQDLIYRSGQTGINKATVSITFDNRTGRSPTGFENFEEITVTRQVVVGGKNKYLINGTTVQNKRVQDLFCSVGLNVNNPHFLIMQGRVTKVLNMKPPEILAMVEEAAGTRMYETKRQAAQKTIEKKDSKLQELDAVFKDEISPKLEKLREERSMYMEYQRLERELEDMCALYQAYMFFATKRMTSKAAEELAKSEEKIKEIKTNITRNKKLGEKIDEEIATLAKNAEAETTGKLKEVEEELRAKEKVEAKVSAMEKAAKENVLSEEKKKQQLEKNLKDDSAALKSKEQELAKVINLFQKLKEADAADSEAFAASQKKYEAVSAGMDVNEDGQTETLQEQLMNFKQEATKANTEMKQASMQIAFSQNQLKEKQKELGNNVGDYEKDKKIHNQMIAEVKQLKNSLSKINFSEEHMNDLEIKQRNLSQEIRNLHERIDNFEAYRPHTKFNYRDPEANFDRRRVKGVVCRLIKPSDKIYSTALETAAGGRLYNVIVDTEITSKKLLKNGNLQQRTTFIPLNKIQGGKIDNKTIKLAQDIVGKENVQPALSLIHYDKELQPAMEFIFGNIFICKDMNTAKAITFHNNIRRRCVTLEGDVTDPSGTLSGGALQKGPSVLLQIEEIQQNEKAFKEKENELIKIENEIQKMGASQEQYAALKQKFELKNHEVEMLERRMQQTTHAQQQQEVDHLKATIEELNKKLKTYKEVESKCLKKVNEIEATLKDAKGYREKQLKETEAEMKALKKKADGSRKEWKQREQEYETLNLEITELKKTIENLKEQIEESSENIIKLKEEYEKLVEESKGVKIEVEELQRRFKEEKSAIAEKNKEIQKKNQKKEQILAQISEFELEIKKINHEVKKCEDDFRNAQQRENEASKRVKSNDKYLKEAEKLSEKEAINLEKQIRNAQERKNKLSRTVNTKAQSMFDQEEKQYTQLLKKKAIVESDKRKLLMMMADLDKKKKETLELAFQQVSKDFGSIFGTLLPGANVKLQSPPGSKGLLEGLEIKVCLGGVWKESLSELSGGQRSLVALSLVLAMLLFKPAPLYILDEVDAALDLSHTQNIGNMLKSHFKQSQFIIVSLKDGMFSNANVLFRTKFVDGMSAVTRTENRTNR